MNLDTLAGGCCLVTAFAVFVLEITTSNRKKLWPDLPPYVRVGLFATGATILYRGVNFLTVTQHQPRTVLGHVNVEGVFAAACLAYTMSAMAVWVVTRSPSVQAAMAAVVARALGAVPRRVRAKITHEDRS